MPIQVIHSQKTMPVQVIHSQKTMPLQVIHSQKTMPLQVICSQKIMPTIEVHAGTCSVCDAVPHKPQEVSHISPSTAVTFNSRTIPSHTTEVAAQIKVLQQAISDLRKDVRKLNSCQRRIQHCHLYVSSNHSLTTTNTITARVALESMLGCPIHQAQSLREGPRKSFKVKLNKDHLLVALSSYQGKNHRVRLWKPRSVLSTSPTTTSPTHESAMQTRKLNISSWNARGLKNSVPYLQVLYNTSDIILIQEHWLWPFKLHSLSSLLSGFTGHGLCDRRLNETSELLRGCGGIAILWKKSIAAHPIHLNIDNDRICGIEPPLENHIIKKLLVFNIYFPSTDTEYSTFTQCVLDLEAVLNMHSDVGSAVVIAGDFNTHTRTLAGPRGTGSPNQRGLLVKEFVDRNNLLISSHAQVSSGPSFTYHSGDRFSTVDYVIINRTASDLLDSCGGLFDHPLNVSDHLPLFIALQVHYSKAPSSATMPKINWGKAISTGSTDIFAKSISNFVLPFLSSSCDDATQLEQEISIVCEATWPLLSYPTSQTTRSLPASFTAITN